MKTEFLFVALGLTFLFACQPDKPSEEERSLIYQSLTLQERRQPEHAMMAMETHPELEAGLFASEPMVTNPTNIDVDAKGRVWVCEAYNYGLTEDQKQEKGGKISILEDLDGDGKADKKTVFYQGEDVSLALGIAVLGNKVFVSQSPNLLIFTDQDGDDQPDRKEVMFTGMGGPGDHSAHALIFGPDGKLYFNYGNAGQKVLYPDQSPVIDKAGNQVISNGKPYYGGMIFRCNPDGSEFEVLAHNFRNNYEVTVDTYGNIWQSDNDDDGNKSCRINFILEYGNYGYRDQLTGQHWSVSRTGQAMSTAKRHWHQNDPGSVPNLLITGAGSPAGICFYEGKMLPDPFQNQMIHTDAGPNVVRAYPVEKSGAGYHASIENILWSDRDKWFRPVDVTVAPDGSLMVADWYDPIVGGGAVGDTIARGRIYRISNQANQYVNQYKSIDSPEAASEALKSPNMATRYLGWQFLNEMGLGAEEVLLNLWNNNNQVYRARALWLLGQIPEVGPDYITQALKDENEDIRVTAVRLAAQMDYLDSKLYQEVVKDPSMQVRRTLLSVITHKTGKEKAVVWAELAQQYDGQDPWYLEALGIAADNDWKPCFAVWLAYQKPDMSSKAVKDLIWRSRAAESLELKLSLILDSTASADEITRMFRSLDFLPEADINEALLGLLKKAHPKKDLIERLVVQHIDHQSVVMTTELRNAIRNSLDNSRGTHNFVTIIDRYGSAEYQDDLLELALSNTTDELKVNAIRVLIENQEVGGLEKVRKVLLNDSPESEKLIQTLAPVSTENAFRLIKSVIMHPDVSLAIKKAAVQAYGKTWWGEEQLLELVKSGNLPSQLEQTAASVLFSVYRANIRKEAADLLEQPGLAEGSQIPPVRDLLSFNGNQAQGKIVFDKFCLSCHQVNQKGVKFGPDLSQIGDKLSKEGLFQSIIYPDQGINNGFEGYLVTLKNGSMRNGILMSEGEESITIRQMGGTDHTIQRSDIEKIEMMDSSLMTSLVGAMSQEELVDLVAYLTSLKGTMISKNK
ncbi:MAG: PVC-type heme-binding CxxCH protein [Candidatus Cyclobacteriaceae bacterium M3_2C_046]